MCGMDHYFCNEVENFEDEANAADKKDHWLFVLKIFLPQSCVFDIEVEGYLV